MGNKEEREFLHDLSNSLSIAQGNVKLVLRKLSKDPSSLSTEDIVLRLEKAGDAFDRISVQITDRRNQINS